MIIDFFKVIRYKNLLLLTFLLIVLRYGFLKLQQIPLALSDIYVSLNIAGVMIGFYLSNVIEKPSFASIFIVIAATLYMYATALKQTPLIGNILAAFLTSFTIIIVGIFDLYPILNSDNQATQAVYFKLLIDYAIFAFIINLMREIVKDIQDITGDDAVGMRTLPIVIGVKKTKIIVASISIIFSFAILFYVYTYYYLNNLYIAVSYILLTVLSPLILFSIKIFDAKTTKDFGFLSRLLKIIIGFGILSALIVTINILQNAKG